MSERWTRKDGDDRRRERQGAIRRKHAFVESGFRFEREMKEPAFVHFGRTRH